MKHIWKMKDCFCRKGEKCDIAKGYFFKITETACWEPPRKAAYSGHSIIIHSISKAGYVTAVLAIVRAELHAREASSFCDFWNITLRFHLFYSNICFFEMCLIRRTIANLCPIIKHCNALDCSECRSEKVMFLLTLSVCTWRCDCGISVYLTILILKIVGSVWKTLINCILAQLCWSKMLIFI